MRSLPILAAFYTLSLAACGGGSIVAGGLAAGDGQAVVQATADKVPTASTPPASAPASSSTPAGTPTASTPAKFVFGPYKDVTVGANYNTGAISTLVPGTQTAVASIDSKVKLVTWSFATGECGSESWGGITSAQLVSANVPAWVAANKQYMLATGGAGGAFTCATDAGFATFLDRYMSSSFVGVDFDIEAGQSQATVDALVARVKAAQANPKYKDLRFSFTIATLGGNASPSLGPTGISVMQAIAAGGLSNYYVNLMTMDFGSTSAANCVIGTDGKCDMGASSVQAAKSLNAAYKLPFSQIEITPMVGGNDTVDETFTLADVATVAKFARQVGLGGVHFWSLDRDIDCPAGAASPTCNSYGKAGPFGFLTAFNAALAAP